MLPGQLGGWTGEQETQDKVMWSLCVTTLYLINDFSFSENYITNIFPSSEQEVNFCQVIALLVCLLDFEVSFFTGVLI